MKRLLIILYFFCFLIGNADGQVRPSGLPASEERAAKNLAVSFFNRFAQTKNLTSLIKEYFVKDFERRLKFCDTTGKCDGSDRDFWGEKENFAALKTTETDSLRLYTISINYLFLYFRSVQHLNHNYPQKMSDNDLETASKFINKKLEILLKDNPKLVKFNFFDDSDNGELFKVKSLNEFRHLLNNYEKLIAALRTLESTLRTRFQKEHSTAKLSYKPKDFRVYAEENYNNFFDYPIGTKMTEVWCENGSLIFKLDLIEENGELKIVAIYPPID